MPTVTRTYSFTPGTTIVSGQVNTNENTVYNAINGALDSDNIASLVESKVTFSGSGHSHSGGTGGAPIQLVKGADLASAATLTIGTDGNYFVVTGTTTITALSTRPSGVIAILRFSGVLAITHNAVSLILLAGKSLVTQAGDVLAFISEGSGNWREIPFGRSRSVNAYRVVGLVGQNDATTPNTKFGFSADLVLFTDGTIKTAVATVTNDISLDNTNANGRDQAAAFGASSWIHFYYVLKNDGTVLSRSSTTAPPTGPALQTGEIAWAYVGAVRYNATPLLVKTRMRGSWMYYEAFQNALTNGTATVETAITLTSLIPPNSLVGLYRAEFQDAAAINLNIRYVSGANYWFSTSANTGRAQSQNMIPNLSQQVFYLFSAAPATGLNLDVFGYSVPNGDA